LPMIWWARPSRSTCSRGGSDCCASGWQRRHEVRESRRMTTFLSACHESRPRHECSNRRVHCQRKGADVLEHCVARHTVLLSEFIVSELREHLVGKFKYEELEADEVVALLRQNSQVVIPGALESPVCRDPDG